MKRLFKHLLITLFWFGVWALIAKVVNKPLLLPYPWKVFARFFELAGTWDFYRITANSLWTILLGILAALAASLFLTLVTCRFSVVRDAVHPVLTVIKATPVASFIILALIALGSAKVPTFITFLMVLPVVWTNLDEGYRNIDSKLKDLTSVYKMSPKKRFLLLYYPSLKPYFLSACKSSLGLAWKAGIAAEIIAMPRNSIGTEIGNAKQYILTEDVFAWTLTVIFLSLLIETLFTKIIDRKMKGAVK